MSDDRDLGGESACWAHFVDELDGREAAPTAGMTDLAALAEADGVAADGAVWSLPHGGDLDANVVRLQRGHTMAEHVNDEVDVIIVVWRGDGEAAIDGRSIQLLPGIVVHVPRGARRSIAAGADDLTYLTVHRRRDPLRIRPKA